MHVKKGEREREERESRFTAHVWEKTQGPVRQTAKQGQKDTHRLSTERKHHWK